MARARRPESARRKSCCSSCCPSRSSSSWRSSSGDAAKLESKDRHRRPLRPPRTAKNSEGMIVLVETAGLTKVFGEVRAVDDLTVKIPDGAIGLVGPNGAGKTTFLRLLLSLLRPTAGPPAAPRPGISAGPRGRGAAGGRAVLALLAPAMTYA